MISPVTLLVAVLAVASGQFAQQQRYPGQQQQVYQGQQQQVYQGQQQQVYQGQQQQQQPQVYQGQQQQVYQPQQPVYRPQQPVYQPQQPVYQPQQPVYQPQQPSATGFNCPTPDGTFEYTLDCRKYYKCDNSVPTIMSCAQQMLFNRITSYCDWPSNVTCAVNPPAKDYIKAELANLCTRNVYGGPSNEVFLRRHPRICNMYFTCTGGYFFPTCSMCAPGTYFSQDKGLCLRLPVDENLATGSSFCNNRATYVLMRQQVLYGLSDDCWPFSNAPNPNKALYDALLATGLYN